MPTVHVIGGDDGTRRKAAKLLSALGHRAEEYGSAREFLSASHGPHIGCVLAELDPPGMDGLELMRAFSRDDGYLPFIFVASDGNVRKSVEAIQAGAVDVLTRPIDRRALARAVEAALEESRQGLSIRRRVETLTPREYEVLTYVISGLLNKQIGVKLNISEKTVKVHRSRAFRKLEVDSLAALVRLCDRIGVEPRR